MSDAERIKELEEQVKSYAESAFTARKLLGEALFKLNGNAGGRSAFHLVEDTSGWKDSEHTAKRKVFDLLHLGRHQAGREKDDVTVHAFEAAIAELEK